ncbi:MAG: oligoendopeptidase F [Oscillospiraceae bacterium]|nr:oligoendopeptidase F [Oscillospiraceae bacterium]
MKKMISIAVALTLALSLALPITAQTPTLQETAAEYQWDLTAVYADKQAFEQDMRRLEQRIIPELTAYSGKLRDGDSVYNFLTARDRAEQVSERLWAYAFLKTEQNQTDNEATAMLLQAMKADFALQEALVFAEPELLKLPASFWNGFLREERVKPFLNRLSRMFETAKHTLPENEAALLIPLKQSAEGSYIVYSKLTGADMKFPTVTDSQGERLTADEPTRYYTLNNSPDRALRKKIMEANFSAYGQYRNVFAQNINNYIQANVSLAKIQNYDNAKEMYFAEYAGSLEIYNNLISAANNNLDTAHRNSELRKRTMKAAQMYVSDMYYPLTEEISTSFKYEDGEKLLNNALAPLGAEYQSTLKKAFSDGWIDVYPTEGKGGGAFSAGVYAAHPYILMNYTDDYYSLSTLAHELGHAVHQYNSAQNNKNLYDGSPTIFTSEVASTVNELLLSDYMVNNAKTDDEKLFYLYSELLTLHATFFTQIMYSEFEDSIYKIVENGGSLTADVMEELWLEVNTKYNGEGLLPVKGTEYGWSRIPHFYYDYYVYQYATSIAAACTISQRITDGEDGAVEAYLSFLKSGDSDSGTALLKLAGVDMESPALADALIDRYNKVIDQIEEIQGMR